MFRGKSYNYFCGFSSLVFVFVSLQSSIQPDLISLLLINIRNDHQNEEKIVLTTNKKTIANESLKLIIFLRSQIVLSNILAYVGWTSLKWPRNVCKLMSVPNLHMWHLNLNCFRLRLIEISLKTCTSSTGTTTSCSTM